MQYDLLEALPISSYLRPELFRTESDVARMGDSRAYQQYAQGREIGELWPVIHISTRSVWGASGIPGSSLSSYEGIGYHAFTKELLQGFLDSPAEIRVSRADGTRGVIRNRKIVRIELPML